MSSFYLRVRLSDIESLAMQPVILRARGAGPHQSDQRPNRDAIANQWKGPTTMSNIYRFVRSVSPNDLRTHLLQSDIPVPANLNWDAPEAEFSQGFLMAVDELPEQKLIQLVADIDRISDMTDEVGQAALM
jgi:hypothetical protein